MPGPVIALSYVNLLVDDLDLSAAFWGPDGLGLAEKKTWASATFRAFDAGEPITLGLSSSCVRQALNLPKPQGPGVYTFLTFDPGSVNQVDVETTRLEALGAVVLKAPAETDYGAWQSVLADPAGHVFRLSHFIDHLDLSQLLNT